MEAWYDADDFDFQEDSDEFDSSQECSEWTNLNFTVPTKEVATSIVIGTKARLESYDNHLDHVKKDIAYLYNEFQNAISLESSPYNRVSFESIMYYYFCGAHAMWRPIMEDRINKGLRAMNKENTVFLRQKEIINFIEHIVACHFYGKSPTFLHDQHYVDDIPMHRTMSYERFEELLRALGIAERTMQGDEDAWTDPEDSLNELRNCQDLMFLIIQFGRKHY